VAVKLLDIGLAKVTSWGNVNSGLIHEGQMLGAPSISHPSSRCSNG
jgi:hypothetical protein